MSWRLCMTVGALGLNVVACGGEAGLAPGRGEAEQESTQGPPGAVPEATDRPGASPSIRTPGTVSEQASPSCVELPAVRPRQPVLSYEEGCAVSSFEPSPDVFSSAGGEDGRALLVGRWRLCGDVAYYGGAQHAGLEFGSNGRNQLLWNVGGDLEVMSGGPRGVYYMLGSGQFMQRGELTLGGYAAQARFDATLSVLQLESDNGADAPLLRYVRIPPDERSAAANTFSTASAECSMVGVWDTAVPSSNPGAAFAFNERGEWFGGERGSDLCAGHTMYGTYNLETRGGNVMDNFDSPAVTEFELVTNIGAGVCDFWFNAVFVPTFSADCSRVHLASAGDNCTGGRGFLNAPGDDLIRRVP